MRYVYLVIILLVGCKRNTFTRRLEKGPVSWQRFQDIISVVDREDLEKINEGLKELIEECEYRRLGTIFRRFMVKFALQEEVVKSIWEENREILLRKDVLVWYMFLLTAPKWSKKKVFLDIILEIIERSAENGYLWEAVRVRNSGCVPHVYKTLFEGLLLTENEGIIEKIIKLSKDNGMKAEEMVVYPEKFLMYKGTSSISYELTLKLMDYGWDIEKTDLIDAVIFGQDESLLKRVIKEIYKRYGEETLVKMLERVDKFGHTAVFRSAYIVADYRKRESGDSVFAKRQKMLLMLTGIGFKGKLKRVLRKSFIRSLSKSKDVLYILYIVNRDCDYVINGLNIAYEEVGKELVLKLVNEVDIDGRTILFLGETTESAKKLVRIIYGNNMGLKKELREILEENIGYLSKKKDKEGILAVRYNKNDRRGRLKEDNIMYMRELEFIVRTDVEKRIEGRVEKRIKKLEALKKAREEARELEERDVEEIGDVEELLEEAGDVEEVGEENVKESTRVEVLI